MARVRNTKLRAQRIQLDYFTRRHWLRSARGWLGFGALVAAGLWVAHLATTNDRRPVSPGPVSAAHHLIAARCETCHADPGGAQSRWLAATDGACRQCHRVADHQAAERETPSCTTCHVEHHGAPALAAVATTRCTDCHGDLPAETKGHSLLVGADAQHIRGLADGHPEFAVRVGRAVSAQRVRLDATPPPTDTSQIKFSHAKHLAPNLRGPAGNRDVQLVCGDCHQAPLAAATLPYGKKPPEWSAATAPDFAPAEEPQYFAPVRYETHCAACHPHTFDPRIEAAPHDTPYIVRRFLQGAYARYALEHPGVLAGTPRRRPIAGGAVATAAPAPDEWARDEVAAAEQLLFRQACPDNEPCPRCRQCHLIDDEAGAEVPTVRPPTIPLRWLPQSRFDHGAHRVVACTECHGEVAKSASATDVMLPRLATCRSCHHPDGASDRCAECHTYHGATAAPDMNGPQTIRRLSASSGGGGT
jgi:hypothetical protein